MYYSLGGESLSVAQSTYTARWFAGKELALGTPFSSDVVLEIQCWITTYEEV
jgi:hypothetical protein